MLAELKFPLQQIIHSKISWNEEADLAWQGINTAIALEIGLTILEPDDQLVLPTDSLITACSCILWVYRDNALRVVSCHSKLLSHTDLLKFIHPKKTWVIVLAFDNFKVYLFNIQKPVIVFTNARPLWGWQEQMEWLKNWPKYSWKYPCGLLCTF